MPTSYLIFMRNIRCFVDQVFHTKAAAELYCELNGRGARWEIMPCMHRDEEWVRRNHESNQ